MIRVLFFSMFILLSTFSFGQELKDGKLEKGFVCKSIIINGDTLPLIELPPFEINDYVHVMSPTEKWYWDRLVYNIKVVLPYAKLAGEKLRQYNSILLSAKNETEKKRLMKQAEKELKAQFGKQIMDLTFTQGEILMKLVDKETGNTTYDIVKELRGSFIVFFYQNIGRLFGYNLKVQYDPNGKDHQIATAIYMIENGMI
jgi:hypothetical protein